MGFQTLVRVRSSDRIEPKHVNAMLRCTRGENSSTLLDRCKCLEDVCADEAARQTLLHTHDHQQLLSTDTSERTRRATNMSAATVISFPMNSTKTARYHDATNDMLYLTFFMVFPTKFAKKAQSESRFSRKRSSRHCTDTSESNVGES